MIRFYHYFPTARENTLVKKGISTTLKTYDAMQTNQNQKKKTAVNSFPSAVNNSPIHLKVYCHYVWTKLEYARYVQIT